MKVGRFQGKGRKSHGEITWRDFWKVMEECRFNGSLCRSEGRGDWWRRFGTSTVTIDSSRRECNKGLLDSVGGVLEEWGVVIRDKDS